MNDEFLPPPSFPALAAMFEGGLAVLAVALGWFLGYPPLASLSGDLSWLAMSLAGVLPPLVILGLCLWVPTRPFIDVMGVVDSVLVPLFKNCRVIELACISLLAGLGEEMLFRGVLQPALTDWIGAGLSRLHGGASVPSSAEWLAAGGVAVLFGLAHAVNRGYALLAAAIGFYLGWLYMITGDLTLPVATHALYDFLALVYIAKLRRPTNLSCR
jgi:uncharacterized protein